MSIPSAALAGYHPIGRYLLGADDAEITYTRSPIGVFDIYLIARPGVGTVADLQDELHELTRAQARADHVFHVQVDGVRATAWTGPADYVGLRYRYQGMTVGFTGRYGATVRDFKRIAEAMTIVAHSP